MGATSRVSSMRGLPLTTAPEFETSRRTVAIACRPSSRMSFLEGPKRPMSAAGDRGQDRHLRPVRDLGLEAVAEPDVLAAYVHVDEAAQLAVVADPLAQVAVAVEEGVEDLADGGAVDLGLRLALGDRAQLGGNLDRDRHLPGRGRNPTGSLGLELVQRRLDLPPLEGPAGNVEGLQALAGDHCDDALAGADVAALGQLARGRDRHAAGGLGEEAGGLGREAHAGADLVVADRVDATAGRPGQLERVR